MPKVEVGRVTDGGVGGVGGPARGASAQDVDVAGNLEGVPDTAASAGPEASQGPAVGGSSTVSGSPATFGISAR